MWIREANVSLWERRRLARSVHAEVCQVLESFVSIRYRGRERVIHILLLSSLQPWG